MKIQENQKSISISGIYLNNNNKRLFSLKMNKLKESLENLGKNDSITSEEKQVKQIQLQKRIDDCQSKMNEYDLQELKKEEKAKEERLEEEIKRKLDIEKKPEDKKQKADQMMMEGLMSVCMDSGKLKTLCEAKTELTEGKDINTLKAMVIDKVLSDVSNSYKENMKDIEGESENSSDKDDDLKEEDFKAGKQHHKKRHKEEYNLSFDRLA